jgi:serine/threonine-protein kinase
VRPSNPDPVSPAHPAPSSPAPGARRLAPARRNRRRPTLTRAAVAIVALIAALVAAVAGKIALADDEPGGGGSGRLAQPGVTTSATSSPTASPTASASATASPARTQANPPRTTTKGANTGPTQDTRPKIPNVVGMSVADARAALTGAGFKNSKVVGRIAESGSQVGKVVAQDPAAGTRADSGSSVTLFEGQPGDPPISTSPSRRP